MNQVLGAEIIACYTIYLGHYASFFLAPAEGWVASGPLRR